MNQSVNLYLASGVREDVGFWIVNFTEEEDILNSNAGVFLECYRKELLGLEAAIEVMEAINTTLDILSFESKLDYTKFYNSTKTYSSEIPLNIIEDIFDLWADNYNDEILWRKYIGLLKVRKKIKMNNKYIYIGLKGDIYAFAIKLYKILSFRSEYSSFNVSSSNQLMW